MSCEFVSVTSRAAIVVICAALLASCAATDKRSSVEEQTPAEQAAPAPRPPAAPQADQRPPPAIAKPTRTDQSHKRISIAAVGDMMLGTDYPEDRLPDDDGANFLAAATPFLSSADFAVGNLEGVLADGGSPKKQCDNPNACYLFRSPTRYAQRLRAAGFDALSLANNHARDFGEDGRSSSMRALDDIGIAHSGRTGTFSTAEVNGLSVVFIAFAVTQKSNLLHDYDLAFAVINEHAKRSDITIVSFHGGAEGANVMRLPFAEEEYYGEPRGDVVWFARGAVDAGADLVLGHGPHVVRAMERYKDRLIAYSLGNFATYYGISVSGDKGIAPLLTATLDGNGAFVSGEIVSTRQLRPNGPSIDPHNAALRQLRDLSQKDFGQSGLHFADNGTLLPTPRESVKPHQLVVAPD